MKPFTGYRSFSPLRLTIAVWLVIAVVLVALLAGCRGPIYGMDPNGQLPSQAAENWNAGGVYVTLQQAGSAQVATWLWNDFCHRDIDCTADYMLAEMPIQMWKAEWNHALKYQRRDLAAQLELIYNGPPYRPSWERPWGARCLRLRIAPGIFGYEMDWQTTPVDGDWYCQVGQKIGEEPWWMNSGGGTIRG